MKIETLQVGLQSMNSFLEKIACLAREENRDLVGEEFKTFAYLDLYISHAGMNLSAAEDIVQSYLSEMEAQKCKKN